MQQPAEATKADSDALNGRTQGVFTAKIVNLICRMNSADNSTQFIHIYTHMTADTVFWYQALRCV
jgi:hypothetical protein